MFAPIITAANQNQLTQLPKDSLMDSEGGILANQNQLLQSVEDSLTDSEEDSSADTSLPKILMETKLVQPMNKLLTQLITKPSTEIHPTFFDGTATANVLDWLESFNRITIHNVWNDQKQLRAIDVYLKNTTLNCYCSLPEQTKGNIELFKTALRVRYHKQDHLYGIRVELHESKQGSSLQEYISNLDKLARQNNKTTTRTTKNKIFHF